MKKWQGKLKAAGALGLSCALAFGAGPGMSMLVPGVDASTSQTRGAKVSDNLKLQYDEPARAEFGEIFASKYSFMWQQNSAGEYVFLGDGWLEFGRGDIYNYTDKKNHSNDKTGPNGTWDVTDAVKKGVAWAKHALPVGNGHMGAMSFGYTDTEIIQMNEDTLWTGGPGSEDKLLSTNNGDVYGNKNLTNPSSTMKKLVDNAFTEFYKSQTSGALPDNSVATPYNVLTTNSREQEGAYQSFCEMEIKYDHNSTSNYKRELDLNQALSTVSYDYNGTGYNTELFASYPDDVIVYKVAADENSKVSFTVSPKIPHMDIHQGRYNSTVGSNQGDEHYGKEGTVVAEGDTITLSGSLNHNDMQFAGTFKVVTKGGTQTPKNDVNAVLSGETRDNGSITVENADEAYIIVSLTTDYLNDFDKDYRTGETLAQLADNVKKKVDTAASKGYEQLLSNHLEDYTELFDRVKLDIGAEIPEDTMTDELIDAYTENYKGAKKDENYNKYLETLYYQYGRYLLIASSREGDLPANLQGNWNDTDRPAWSSDYHTNINLQMNYWLAESTNLAETATSLIDFANSLRKPGRLSLAKLYGIGFSSDESQIDLNTEDGFVFFCSTNPLGFTGNIDSNASFTQTATAFLGQNVYDYYAFTKDKGYLQSDIYPYLREACVTYLQTLEPGRTDADKNKLYVAPSWSSEQGPWTVGTYFDQQLVWQLFHDTIDAMEDLGITKADTIKDDTSYLTDDSQLLARLEDALDRLDPVQLGTDGQIKEWQQEFSYNKTKSGAQLGAEDHRHISQLMALYPGNYINKEDTSLINGAKVVLQKRGDESTGWGEAYRLNLWARVGDGNHSYDIVNALLATSTYDNLFDTHAPFQIDGNFGATAGITEMLLQSQNDKVEMLPAIPDAWSNGSVEGLVARGNFEVSMQWSDKTVDYAEVIANAGGELVIDKDGIELKQVRDGMNNTVSFTTNADGDYVIDTAVGTTYRLYTTEGEPTDGPIVTPRPTKTPAPVTPKPTATPKPVVTATPSPTPTPTVTTTPTPSPAGSTTTPPTIPPTTSPDPGEILLGDMDGKNGVTLDDVQYILKMALTIVPYSNEEAELANMDQKGDITLDDVQLALKVALTIIDPIYKVK